MFKKLKQNARLALKGSWDKAFGIIIIYALLTGSLALVRQYALSVLSTPRPASLSPHFWTALLWYMSSAEVIVMSVFSLLSVLFIIPLTFGVAGWFYSLVQGQSHSLLTIFSCFESAKTYCRTVWLHIQIFVRTLFWGLVFMALPGGLFYLSMGVVYRQFTLFADNLRLNATFGTIGVVLSVILLVLAAIFYLIFISRYTLAVYIFWENPEQKISQVLKSSVQFSHGYRSSLLLFELTFVPWFLLSVAIIPLLFVYPYYCAGMALYARYLIERSQRIQVVEPTQEFSMSSPKELPTPEPDNQQEEPHEAPPVDLVEEPAETDAAFPQNSRFGQEADQ